MPEWLSIDYLQHIAEQHRIIGSLIAVGLPFLEAFLPFLPLAAFVVMNASAYGLWIGFLLSWSGAVLGSYCVFLLIRKYGHLKIFRFITERSSVQKLIKWIQFQGFTPLFVLLCFPFTPSALVNVVAGLSNLKKKHYLFTIMSAKLVMIFVISWIGSDLQALITNPWRTVIVILIIAIMWFGGKRVEAHNHKKMEAHLRNTHKNNHKSAKLK